MQTVKFLDIDCLQLENDSLSLLVTESVGPRILSLRYKGGPNLFAEVPDSITSHPDGTIFHFYGGHRLWHAPEAMPRTYVPDDEPVVATSGPGSLTVTRPAEPLTGLEKSIQITLVESRPQVIVRHSLTNRGVWDVECAPWAITQFRTGGMAILPQSQEPQDFLPNRSIAIWPYTDLASPHLKWGSRYILVHAEMSKPFKLGFPNPRGWAAYWLDGTLFVKTASFEPKASYYDFGSSSECYCNHRFLELETLGPISTLAPEETVEHVETWEIYPDIEFPADESIVQSIADRLELE